MCSAVDTHPYENMKNSIIFIKNFDLNLDKCAFVQYFKSSVLCQPYLLILENRNNI